MHRVEVSLNKRSYPVMIGSALLAKPESWAPWLGDGAVLVVSNEVVAPLYLAQVMESLQDRQVHQLVLPDGESAKTPISEPGVLFFICQRFERDSKLPGCVAGLHINIQVHHGIA